MKFFLHTFYLHNILKTFNKAVPVFRIYLRISFIVTKIFSFREEPETDIVYIIANKGWVLEGFCKDIDKHIEAKTNFHYVTSHIPPAKLYYFSHPFVFILAVLKKPAILQKKTIVQYTHTSKNLLLNEHDMTFFLNQATCIFVMNNETLKYLVTNGVESERIKLNFTGIDPDLFFPDKKPHSRPLIGFNLRYASRKSYSERKNYNKIIDIIKTIDFCDVILLGKDWPQYERFKEISELPYFKYVETSYREYAKFYQKMDVFVSVSNLEGGPVPLLEAMFCDVLPVVSKTGFAPDLIKDGENGLLFDTEASTKEIIAKIKKGLQLSRITNVSETVNHLTWKKIAKDVNTILN